MALILRKTPTSRGVARLPQTTETIPSRQMRGRTIPSKNVLLQDHVQVEEVAMALAGQKGAMDVLLTTTVFTNQLLEALWHSIPQGLRPRQTKAALAARMVKLFRRIPRG
ncbi:hypothetical protein EMPG_14715 [Blastomyces silverae]|uniref:Uncharacterized protein n=1 Tax=Blastomyces silverae TaxID=2060906 RepID=A0A0H1BEV4_9EURO|nr:hypothetical protein EMPG_14715 [Blastomyces silverae]